MTRRLPIFVLALVGLVAGNLSAASAADSKPRIASGLEPQALVNDALVDLGAEPFDVVFTHGGDKAFVSVPALSEVIIFDPTDWSEIDRVDVGGEPHGLDIVHDDSVVLVAVRGTGEVIEISTTTFAVVDRLYLGALLGDDRTHDVFEVADNDVLVTSSPSSSGSAYVVRYDRDAPGGALRVADRKIIRATPTIYAERGADIAAIGAGFSPNSLYVIDLTDPAAPVIAEDAHGSVSGTLNGAIDGSRGQIHLGSGQVISLTTATEIADTGDGGYPVLNANRTRLYLYEDETVRKHNATTFQFLDAFEPSCPYFDDYLGVTGVTIDPTDTVMILRHGGGLCLEPLDGSGPKPFDVTFDIANQVGGCCVVGDMVVVDAEFNIVAELEGSSRYMVKLTPGDYAVAVGNMTDSSGWPFFAVWHDGSPLLTREEPALLTIARAMTVEIDVWPAFYDILDASETFWDSIFWLQATGITGGCAQTRYCPKEYVTRGQMAAFLDRALDLPTGPDPGFTDDDGTFRQNIWNLKAAGITTGCAPNRYCTNDYVTREQMAAFLFRALADDWPFV